ncbi:helix-turn-helix domain-containing protein [Natrarchaeobius oligotrophus]|uniref:Helix-turn-helix domain-containing protein n=1 Tax=Natrarchaeobius chitinivorans TaxID=1679083 RepID=A0A3N6M0F8_NATCH|nr:helix-turn-helix domain-containing protein [Natrarchaeobius chitinivorans]RQG93754.1 helix-turn-helix domain-containing protein [Natrarchaeobius chitinivorans]
MTDAGLSPTRQVPAAAAVIEISDQPVTDLWSELFDHADVVDAFVRAVRELAHGQTVPELYDDLEERGVPYWIRSRIRDVALGDRREAWRLGAEIVPTLGQGHSTVEDVVATAKLFDALEGEPPTIAFVVDREFEQLERRKRVKICRLIAALSQGLDVRFVATGVTQAFVQCEHRDQLPGVSDWRHTDRTDGPLADVVDAAVTDLDPDGRDVATLRRLADEDSEALSYSQLYGEFPEVDGSRVRQTILSLERADLVSTFDPKNNRKVELLEAGRRVLDVLDAEIGRQSELSDCVSDSGKSSPQCRVTPRTGGGGEDGARPFDVGWMSRHNHAAAAACATAGSVAVTDGQLPAGDGRTHEVSYDRNADEAVVAVQASEPLPYTVSTAVALATPWFLDDILPPSRVLAIDEPPAILRAGRCIGALSDEALADPQILRDELVDWGQRIQDLTVDLRNGNYDDRDAFRSAIMRLAHGLTGSIVHLLDAAGIDLVREIRVPSGADRDDLEELAITVAISAAIQSRYTDAKDDAYNVYRQLFESRSEKRSAAFTPTVDAHNPMGRLIGSIVVRGPDAHRLREPLEAALGSPDDLHEDAPEVAVRVPVTEPDRSAIAAVANRILLPKRIRPTDVGVTLCHAFVPDPFAAARALEQLASEDEPRDLRVDELRYAFATLPTTSILPELPPSAGAIVKALLEADRPLSQSELADRADVSTRTVRNHETMLVSLGVLDGEDGYRLTLSFQTPEERREALVPPLVESGDLLDAADGLLLEYLPPKRYGDPDDPLGRVLFWPPDPWLLEDHDELGPWFDLGVRLVDVDRPSPTEETVVTMGPTVEQQPLSLGGSTEVAG